LIALIEADLRSHKALTERLVLCAANPSFADHLRKGAVISSLKSLQAPSQPSGKALLTSLISRAEGWETLVKALSDENVEFSQVIPWIYDILSDEESFAMFIQGLLQHYPISELLNDVSKEGRVKPLFTRCPNQVSLADRRTFMRALIGVANVLPIFCWANSEGRHHALQRVIHAFLIWQLDPGYADVGTLLSRTQFTLLFHLTAGDQSPPLP
jgi:hypothetical protein